MRLLDRHKLVALSLLLSCLSGPGAQEVRAQFAEVEVPREVSQLDFLLGEWAVSGAFRTPDVIAEDRSLWYRTDRGVTRFDGTRWTGWEPGEDERADAMLARIDEQGRADPYRFEHPRQVRRTDDGFALILDDGRTGGVRLFYFDQARGVWGERGFHAASGSFGFRESSGRVHEGTLLLEGTGADRRGERLIRSRFVPGPDGLYSVTVDVSFDSGSHWILEQSHVTAVRR